MKVSRAPAVLPFLLEDASRSQTDIDASQATERPLASVPQVRRREERTITTEIERSDDRRRGRRKKG